MNELQNLFNDVISKYKVETNETFSLSIKTQTKTPLFYLLPSKKWPYDKDIKGLFFYGDEQFKRRRKGIILIHEGLCKGLKKEALLHELAHWLTPGFDNCDIGFQKKLHKLLYDYGLLFNCGIKECKFRPCKNFTSRVYQDLHDWVMEGIEGIFYKENMESWEGE